mmetsp:Transcript_16501/g.32031  ORF Transcript_16501/g.32031 Transcript_16501/m.32031 type:complete len:600 (+) Transcript_16501:11-1810(+)
MVVFLANPNVSIKKSTGSFFQQAANVAASLELLFPDAIETEIIELESSKAFREWLPKAQERLQGAESHTSSPIVYIDDSDYIGGCDDFLEFARKQFRVGGSSSSMREMVHVNASAAPAPAPSDGDFDYDLVVIGGGSGGLAASKEASELGAKVALLDFVVPSPHGTKWGLGGTCVNVGCIPKKLFHHAALTGEFMHDAPDFGWEIEVKSHNWEKLVDNVRNYIKSLNFGYKVQLREKNVKYLNKLGSLVDPHTVKTVDKKGKEETITAARILIAVGGRPKPLDCEGGELAISSDDMFYLDKAPGKTLVIGASYVALECASFLVGFGYDTTIMVRSILLRGFDQQMADKVGDAMEKLGAKFIRGAVPQKLERTDDGRILVHWDDGSDVFDTVLSAVGRHADTSKIGLENVGIKTNHVGKIKTVHSQTDVPSIFAIGDCVQGILELTPVAIELGRNLAQRLYAGRKDPVDMRCIPTAVFAGLEYSCVGLSEDDAREQYGDAIEVYHTHFTPLQWTVPHNREYNVCYTKVVVNKEENERVLGIHLLSPEAGEVVQAYGICLKFGMTYKDLTELIGIHPTIGEELCLLTEPKSSGKDAVKSGC